MDVAVKPAQADAPILDVVRFRWSPRAFSQQPVAESDLRTILAAAQWAASSFNEQPWRYVVARREQPEQFAAALACLNERNRQWAGGCPLLLFAIGRTRFTHSSQPNRVWQHDVGLASAHLVLQAMALGIYAHQMAGIDLDAVRKTYGVPEEFEPVAAIALGYPGRVEDLPEAFRSGETAARQRRPLAETAFARGWGLAAL